MPGPSPSGTCTCLCGRAPRMSACQSATNSMYHHVAVHADDVARQHLADETTLAFDSALDDVVHLVRTIFLWTDATQPTSSGCLMPSARNDAVTDESTFSSVHQQNLVAEWVLEDGSNARFTSASTSPNEISPSLSRSSLQPGF